MFCFFFPLMYLHLYTWQCWTLQIPFLTVSYMPGLMHAFAGLPSWRKVLTREQRCCGGWCTNFRQKEKQNERLAVSVNCLSHQTDFLIPLWLQLAFLVQISQRLCRLHMLPVPNEGALAKGEAVIRPSVREEDRWHAKTSLFPSDLLSHSFKGCQDIQLLFQLIILFIH